MLQLKDRKNKLFLYIFIFLTLSTVSNKSNFHQNIPILDINNIMITGLSDTKNLEITGKLSFLLSQNIFFLKKDRINKILMSDSLIHSYNVKKIFPDKLYIKLKKTKFIALTVNDNKKYFVGANGKLIEFVKSNNDLPYVYGKDSYRNLIRFKGIIDKSSFKFNEIESLFFFPSNRWDIKTRDGVLIKLPQKDLVKTLSLVHTIINNEQMRNNNLIDLRISNQIIISNE